MLSELRYLSNCTVVKSWLIVCLTSLIILYLVNNLHVQMTYNFALRSSSNRLWWNSFIIFIFHRTRYWIIFAKFFLKSFFFKFYTWRWTMYVKWFNSLSSYIIHKNLHLLNSRSKFDCFHIATDKTEPHHNKTSLNHFVCEWIYELLEHLKITYIRHTHYIQ